MNVASLELCKELYELSGWGSDHSFAWVESLDTGESMTSYHADTGIKNRSPAYDLGYLLPKLPKSYKSSLFKLYRSVQNSWWAGYHPLIEQKSTTPEDAAAKLAIELFKQGILTRVGDVS